MNPFIYNRLFAWKQSFAVVPSEHAGYFVSNEFPQFTVDRSRLLPEYLHLIFHLQKTINLVLSTSVGSAAVSRNRFKEEEFLKFEIPLPPLEIQSGIIARWQAAQKTASGIAEQITELENQANRILLLELGIGSQSQVTKQKVLTANFRYLPHWNVRANQVALQEHILLRGKFPVVSGKDILTEVKHGCSSPPAEKPTALEILKISAVTRGTFNPLEKKFAKDNARVRREFDLKKGDVLMCRTNGTLAYVGMSALVDQDYENLIFPDKVIRVKAKENILPKYLWLVLQILPVRLQIESAARTAVGNYAIGTDDIWNLRFPLPPLSVQKQAVNKALASRHEIGRLRERAVQIRQEAQAEVEAMILGTKPG